MMYFLENKHECTGCGACYSACPVKCISMEEDEEGFLYPISSDKCIKCGKCEKVCPSLSASFSTPPVFKKKVYAGLTRNLKIWENSSSGGAFYEICKAWADDETIIVGAAWNGFSVEHVCVKGIKSIDIFHKSKYIASDSSVAMAMIQEYLKNGKKVIFCGTPCQIAGVKSIVDKLKINRGNLLLIDLICHGVGSPAVFKECINRIQDELQLKVERYEFRAKESSYVKNHIQKIKTKKETLLLDNDPYIQLFLSQECLRPSCVNHCKYRTVNRNSDITIADFKAINQVFPELRGVKYNYSSIIFNSENGISVLPKLTQSMELHECTVEDICKYNPLFGSDTISNNTRDDFFKDFVLDRQDAIVKYTKSTKVFHLSLKRKIWRILPKGLRRIVIKTFGIGGVDREYSSCHISRIFYYTNG